MSTQSDAMGRVKKSERRYHVTGITILVLTLLALSALIIYLTQHSTNEVNKRGRDRLTLLQKKIDDSFDAQKRFNCSLAIQLTHSTQTIDDCVKTNKLAETPNTPPINLPQNYQTQTTPSNSPSSTNPSNPSPTSSPVKDTSGEPSQALPQNPPQKNVLQKAGSGIMNLIHKAGGLL